MPTAYLEGNIQQIGVGSYNAKGPRGTAATRPTSAAGRMLLVDAMDITKKKKNIMVQVATYRHKRETKVY